MKRRNFVKGLAVGAGAAMLGQGCGSSSFPSPLTGQQGQASRPPNIIFMMVDELRYPVHFPDGVESADQYLARFMPNLHRLVWTQGVRLTNHRIAAAACSPSRGVILTGLYSHQTSVLTTISGTAPDGDKPPSMPTEFPTYGRLLQAAGYETPYFGKFHCSADVPYENDECTIPPADYLAEYGFQTYNCPDPGGTQGQGVSADGQELGDQQIADLAAAYLQTRTAQSPPFCATVSFVNPHDYEYFWGGTEPVRYMEMFDQAGQTPLVPYDTSIVSESQPPPQGFPPLPSNWEDIETLRANKPSTQLLYNEGDQAIFSAVSFDSNQTDFRLEDSPILGGRVKKAVAPFAYWSRGQDSYAQILGLVDVQIGRVLDALPEEVRSQTVIVFTSDHGDYVGSHGFSTSKVGSVYEEALRVPLVVCDYTGQFSSERNVERRQLTSSIDVMTMLVTMGHNGDRSWIQGDLEALYATRHDLLGVISSAQAPGRRHACFTTDEYISPLLNFNRAPTHILGVTDGLTKLGLYSYWLPRTTQRIDEGEELEFYDYATPGGRAELDNTPQDPRATALRNLLVNELVPGEIQRPLPLSLRPAQDANRLVYLEFVDLLDGLEEEETLNSALHLNFGQDRRQPS